jgi:hypothetical protein
LSVSSGEAVWRDCLELITVSVIPTTKVIAWSIIEPTLAKFPAFKIIVVMVFPFVDLFKCIALTGFLYPILE